MYEKGLKYTIHNINTDFSRIILGTGEKDFHEIYTNYLSKNYNLNKIEEEAFDQFSFNDHHNAFLNTLSKRGLVYFLLYYALISMMLFHSYKLAKTNNLLSHCAFNLILCYLVVGLFYSNSFSYQTIIVFLFWCSLTYYNKTSQNRVEQNRTEQKNP